VAAKSETEQGREFVITRLLNAPRELVYRVWTELDHFQRWFGPKGFTMDSCTLDLRPGGRFHYCMRSTGGQEMWGRFVYRDVVPPERIVFVVSFSDAAGGVTRHPMAAQWPLEVLSTVTFTEQEGKTLLTMRAVPVGATDEECKAFEAGFESMQIGWKGTFEQLEEHLAKGGAR
jgi:uncharacterized protein YndB with AHSA1/START domain